MGMAAILVMWLVPFEQTLFPPSQGSSTWNLASIGPVISEEKMFENVDVRRTAEACLYYKLTSELKGSGELKSVFIWAQQSVRAYVSIFLKKMKPKVYTMKE